MNTLLSGMEEKPYLDQCLVVCSGLSVDIKSSFWKHSDENILIIIIIIILHTRESYTLSWVARLFTSASETRQRVQRDSYLIIRKKWFTNSLSVRGAEQDVGPLWYERRNRWQHTSPTPILSSIPPLPPSLPPSFPTSLPPSLPRHLEPASRDTRGREGVMMKGQGTGEREREGTTEGARWRRGRRKGRIKDETEHMWAWRNQMSSCT